MRYKDCHGSDEPRNDVDSICHINDSAKFERLIRVTKLYADKLENRALGWVRGCFGRQNLFDFL